MERSSAVRYLTCFFLALAIPGAADAQGQRPPSVDNELIVLPKIRFVGPPASGTPPIVARINAGESPGGLALGHPTRARLVIEDRSRGRMAEWIKHNPDTPEGRLQRYIVLEYPENANIDAIETALAHNPNVEYVGRNVLFQMHGIPDDDYVGTPFDDPQDAQWGVHALNLPEAWDWTTGHAYLGIVDYGLETEHPDLRSSHKDLGDTVFDGGSFRAHLSRDVLNGNCSVDETDPDDTYFDPTPGHGSHVMGIAAATTDNDDGVAGTCWNCSVLMTKAIPTGGDFAMDLASAAQGLNFLALRGPQSINMSFGANRRVFAGVWECVPGSDVQALCDAMSVADRRDVVMVASSGNHRIIGTLNPDVDFPALDPRTIAAGGLELDPQLGPVLWVNEACTPVQAPIQCGSWIGPSQDLMAPAQDVLSTVHTGFDHEVTFGCGDSLFPTESGYGLCTGTSMSAPFITGLAGLTRSVNPLLSKEDIRDVLTSTASVPGPKDPELGHGIPDAAAAVEGALGTVFGATLTNRLTPLFAFYSSPPAGAFQAQTRVVTTVPQYGSSFLLNDVRTFDTAGPTVSTYGAFPEFCTDGAFPDCCPSGQPCCVNQGPDCVEKILVDASTQPRASVFIFTNHLPPTPSSPPLVPLYRLRYESALSDSCPSPPEDPESSVRDFAYATSVTEVETYLNGADLGGIFEYELDGIEGYVYEHCNTRCPPEAVALHRLYNASRHDTVVVPASEVATMVSQGYMPPLDPGLPEIIGYAFENVDSDGDGLVDGFERLIGTHIQGPDSDGDGVTDGQELLFYDRSSPDPTLHGYGDPCSNGCPLFKDGFESGDTSVWTLTVSG